ncbi:unnamed protein product [Prorocentrum cordatum]|uniref:MYND-type domain-containing protein n=1 Tax=Prorocentrum cordatum TaxID=2364126 RepID=A0ABN9VBL4_9DINO|nr:unnamed protein product [Polarella glacialis]
MSIGDMRTLSSGHTDLHVRIAVGEAADEGRTLFAQQGVSAGQVILREKPAIVAASRDELSERIAAALAENGDCLAPAVSGNSEACEGSRASEVVSLYSFDFLDGGHVAIFRIIGLLNHACAGSEEANCCLSVPFDAGTVRENQSVALMAVRPILAGEALRMSYICPFAPLARLRELESAHGFRCKCSCCRKGPPCLMVPSCAGCGTCEATLRRCGGCKAVFYCSETCQRTHRAEHRPACVRKTSTGAETPIEQEQRSFLEVAEAEFDRAMDASDTALEVASAALRDRKRLVGESDLESSLHLARKFLRCYSSTASSPILGKHCLRLARGHPFVYYVQGNAVKQVLTRLAMRMRLRGSEPRFGCGGLARQARDWLLDCIASVSAVLPRFHIELLSLLRDIGDLRQLSVDLLSLAADLAVWGTDDEGRISEDGLADVAHWAVKILADYKDVLAAYGERLADVAGAGELDPEDSDVLVDSDSPKGAQCLQNGIDASVLEDFQRDLQMFNDKFGASVRWCGGRVDGLADLSREPFEELKRLCSFYTGRLPEGHGDGVDTADGSDKNGFDDAVEGNADEEPLRFQQGDRVISNLGLYWSSGKIIDVDVVDPSDLDGPRLPYLIKLDPEAGFKEPMSVAVDDDSTVRREVCFHADTEVQFTKASAQLVDSRPSNVKLRFEVGTRVGCRIRDTEDAVSVWGRGQIVEDWPLLPPPHQLPYGRRTARVVPYLVKLDSGQFVYAHRDDHTLIRLEEYIPQSMGRGIAARFESRREADGSIVRLDHYTMRGKKLEGEDADDDGGD